MADHDYKAVAERVRAGRQTEDSAAILAALELAAAVKRAEEWCRVSPLRRFSMARDYNASVNYPWSATTQVFNGVGGSEQRSEFAKTLTVAIDAALKEADGG